MGSEHYCLRWNNHQANLLGVCAQLLRDERLVDVTLACADEGRCIRAHKVVLSACSAYFRALFVDHPARHPIVILKDVRFNDLRTLVEFMYKGEVRVEYAQLSRLLQTAESLKVKGLAEMTREYKPEPPEQTEPEELVNRRPPSTGTISNPTPPPLRSSPLAPAPIIPPPPPRQSITPEPISRPPSQNGSPEPPPPTLSGLPPLSNINNFGPPPPPPLSSSSSSSTVAAAAAVAAMSAASCRQSPPPPTLNCESLPGPSNLPPVQQVPLSLKKEVDWGGGIDEKNSGGESSSDYSRLPHDSPPLEVEQHSGSSIERAPSSASSSRASTPGAALLPFPLAGLLEAGLVPPFDGLGAAAFRCGACLAGFPSPWLLEQHAALQHLPGSAGPDKPFVCDQCGQSYRYRSAYVKHREQNHRARLPADKLFSCDVCGMQFRYLKSFKKHRLNHALERLHGGRKPSSGGGGDSVLSMIPSSATAQGEQGSDQVSSSNETILPPDDDVLVAKVKTEPETDLDNPGCEGGGGGDGGTAVGASGGGGGLTVEADKSDADQDDTIDSRVSGSIPTPAAELLKTADATADAVALATLLRSAADTNDTPERQRERRFACPFCGKCVRSKENLKLHVRKHTGERPFVCLFCGRAFGGKSDLTRHLRIHTGERPYHCDMCGKCFARADYLSKHLTTHINTPR